MSNLPAHLQHRSKSGLATRGIEGLGASQPPHISIQSNQFALVDGNGEITEIDKPYLDVCVIDMSDVTCKMYYGKNWEPGSKEPPLCFSMNGVAPSINASQPQARTCGECELNARGSASSMNGVAIKACRDEKKLAVLADGYDMVFQLTITPGHFKNWGNWCRMFENQDFDMDAIWTRLTFERGKNGVLAFSARPGKPADVYIDVVTETLRVAALAEKKTDLYVGRLDRPRTGELPAPQDASRFGDRVNKLPAPPPEPQQYEMPLAPIREPRQEGSSIGKTVAEWAAQQVPSPRRQTAQAEQAQEAAPPAKRTRRTNAQIAADKATQEAHAETGRAPFRPSPAPNGNFGIQQGIAPDAEMSAAVDSVFK